MDQMNATPALDEATIARRIQDIRDRQNLPLGIAAGVVAAVLGAVGWAAITAITNYQIGFMAVGVGYLVGLAVRRYGRGIDRSFGIIGAVLSLLGCALGNILAGAVIATTAAHATLWVAPLLAFNPELVKVALIQSFDVMEALFYGIAVYEGYRFAIRPITRKELGLAEQPAPPTS